MSIIIALLIGLIVAAGLASLAVRVGLRLDPGGDARQGVAILAGGLRWLGGRWGLRSVPAGLRRAGFAGKFIYWPWHSGLDGWLILPALLDRRRAERQAARLAAFIARRYRRAPHRPTYLFGVSAGGYQIVRALELLPDDVRVRSVALLSAAVDPAVDLAPALAHIDERLVNRCSLLDFIILGAGTSVFGAADGKHSPSAGMVGLRSRDDKLLQLRWRLGMIRTGRLGGHYTCTPPAYVARYIAPAMGIGKTVSGE